MSWISQTLKVGALGGLLELSLMRKFFLCVGPHGRAVRTHYLSLHVTFLANRAWSHLNCPWDSCCQLFWNALKSHSSHLRWGQRATEGGNPQEGGEEDLEGGKLQYALFVSFGVQKSPPQHINKNEGMFWVQNKYLWHAATYQRKYLQ